MIANDFAFLGLGDWKAQRLAVGRSGVAGFGVTIGPKRTAKIEAMEAEKPFLNRALFWIGGVGTGFRVTPIVLAVPAALVLGGILLYRRRRGAAT